jgi:hypothetical protein
MSRLIIGVQMTSRTYTVPYITPQTYLYISYHPSTTKNKKTCQLYTVKITCGPSFRCQASKTRWLRYYWIGRDAPRLSMVRRARTIVPVPLFLLAGREFSVRESSALFRSAEKGRCSRVAVVRGKLG